jgi:hypothetical protein
LSCRTAGCFFPDQCFQTKNRKILLLRRNKTAQPFPAARYFLRFVPLGLVFRLPYGVLLHLKQPEKISGCFFSGCRLTDAPG